MAGLHFSRACLVCNSVSIPPLPMQPSPVPQPQRRRRRKRRSPGGLGLPSPGPDQITLPTHPGTGSSSSGPTAGVAHVAETPGPGARSSPIQRIHRGLGRRPLRRKGSPLGTEPPLYPLPPHSHQSTGAHARTRRLLPVSKTSCPIISLIFLRSLSSKKTLHRIFFFCQDEVLTSEFWPINT